MTISLNRHHKNRLKRNRRFHWGRDLLKEPHRISQAVKAGFVKQGTTLAAYCRDNKIDDSNAHKALRGKWDGVKSKALIDKLTAAANVEITEHGDS